MSEQTFDTRTTDAGHEDRPLQGAHGEVEGARQLLTSRDLARLCGVTDRTLRNWRRDGDLPRQMALSGRPRWSRAVVDAWLEGRKR